MSWVNISILKNSLYNENEKVFIIFIVITHVGSRVF